MKKKSLIALLAATSALCCALGITACGGGSESGGGHRHDYRWTDNGNGTHRQHCSVSGCDEPDVNNGSHVWGANGKCEKCNAEHIHDYKWVDNGDGTHKQHCSVNGCDAPDINSGSHVLNADNECACGAGLPSGQLLNFELNEAGDGYTLTGIQKDSSTDIMIPYTYEGLPVTAIGSDAFATYSGNAGNPDLVEITSISIPASVTEIGDYAFYGTHELKYIYIPETVKSLGNQTLQLSGVQTAEFGCEEIPYCTFYKTTGIEKVILHDGVKTIGEYAFELSSVKEVVIEGNLETIGNRAFCNSDIATISFPESLDTIGDYAFYGCKSIKTVNLEHVKTIGECAFRDSHLGGDLDLTEIETLGAGAFELDGIMSDIGTDYIHENGLEFNNVKLGDKLKTIEKWTFYGRYINNLTLGNGLVEIKDGAFWYNSFSEVVIPDSVTTIAKWAFSDCPNLHSVTYGANMTQDSQLGFTHVSTGPVVEIYNRSTQITDLKPASVAAVLSSEDEKGEFVTDSNNFRFYINKALNVRVLLKSLNGNVTSLPDAAPDGGSYEIGYDAFREKFKGTKLEVPEKVTRIRTGAFSISPSLTTVILGNGVTQIDENAFSTCPNLLSVTIGANVMSIGDNAFNECSRLIEVANMSSLDIQAQSSANGKVAYYAKNVYHPNTSESKLYTTDDGYMFYADADNDIVYLVSYSGSETQLTLPETFLGKPYGLYAYAFNGCDGMTSIVLPDTVTTIDENALCFVGLTIYCKGESAGANWGNDWNGWGCPVVWDCDNNDTDENGYAYAVIGGIRYALKDGEATVAVQPVNISGEITIPVSVTYNDENNTVSETYTVTGIADEAFRDCDKLTGVIVESAITEFGEDVFDGCENLTSITLPDSLTSIDRYTFWGCDNLSDITFNGTTGQWNAIAQANWDRYISEDYTVHCTDGDIIKS